MVPIGVPSVEHTLAVFAFKLEPAMLLFHMLGHMVFLVPCVLALGALPHPEACLVRGLVHLGGHQGQSVWGGWGQVTRLSTVTGLGNRSLEDSVLTLHVRTHCTSGAAACFTEQARYLNVHVHVVTFYVVFHVCLVDCSEFTLGTLEGPVFLLTLGSNNFIHSFKETFLLLALNDNDENGTNLSAFLSAHFLLLLSKQLFEVIPKIVLHTGNP